MPYLDSWAGGDEVAWMMRPERLPERRGKSCSARCR